MTDQTIKPSITKLNSNITDTNQDESDFYTEEPARKKNNIPVIVFVFVLVIIGIAGYLSYSDIIKEEAIQLFNRITLSNLPLSLPPQTTNSAAEIAVTNQGFIPATILVKQETQVTFISRDNKQHQIASDPHPTHIGLPGFFQARPGASYTYTFTKTGTFTYHDEINPLRFKGIIIVEN